MRKTTLLILVILVSILCLCGCQNEDMKKNDNVSAYIENNMDNSDAHESLTQKLLREIDGAYLEEQTKPEFSTTAGMTELADKYAEKWKIVADAYYNKLMEYDTIDPPSDIYYTAEDLHVFVSNMKTNWEQYYQVQCENYVKTLHMIYQGGSIVGPAFAVHKYELQKDWALQLVAICQQLCIT